MSLNSVQVDQGIMSFCYVRSGGYDQDDQDPSQVKGSAVMFCNGVDNEIEEAKKSARLVSYAFKGKPVLVCHNPTSLGTIFTGSLGKPIVQESEELLVMTLANRISDLVLNNEILTIHLVAHSHGAFLTKSALQSEKLINNPQTQNKVRVYSFGGIAMIPKELGHTVENWVVFGDLAAIRIGINQRGGDGAYYLSNAANLSLVRNMLESPDNKPETGCLLDGITSVEERAVRYQAYLQCHFKFEEAASYLYDRNKIENLGCFQVQKAAIEGALNTYTIHIVPGIEVNQLLTTAQKIFHLLSEFWNSPKSKTVDQIKENVKEGIDFFKLNHTFPMFYACYLIKHINENKICTQ